MYWQSIKWFALHTTCDIQDIRVIALIYVFSNKAMTCEIYQYGFLFINVDLNV